MSYLSPSDIEAQFSLNVYSRRGITVVKGKGAHVWDDQGNQYIDCVAGQGVVGLGHCHPAVTAAITHQAETLVTCPNIFSNDVRSNALQALAELTGAHKLFLCNSGAEALETALKFARLLTGKKEVIAMKQGFHGRTMGALSLTWNPKYRSQFQPLIPHVMHVNYNDFEAVEQAVTLDTAAIVVEIIQGEGGVNPGDETYFKALRDFCTEKGILLIVDEVQTGFGRTGANFAHQTVGIQPDIMTMAKSIANGLPMGAVAFYTDLANQVEIGSHGSTFGGNPLACAACLATIDVLKHEQLSERAQQLGEKAIQRLQLALQDVSLVKSVRGRGLMIGIELRQRVTPILQQLMEKRILALPAGPTVLRLLPPLVIAESDLDDVIETITNVLRAG